MTCPNCGRVVRAQIMLLAIADHITDDTLVRLYTDTLKENDMHLHLIHNVPAPIAGDIGEEQEEWEVLPTHTESPVEVPAEPVPA